MVPGTQQMVLVHGIAWCVTLLKGNAWYGRIVVDANYLRSGILLLSHLPTVRHCFEINVVVWNQ